MNKIYRYWDRAWACFNCHAHDIPETDIQLALGRCPDCGEYDGLYRLNKGIPMYYKEIEHYNYRTGNTYYTREPYYPSPIDLKRKIVYNV